MVQSNPTFRRPVCPTFADRLPKPIPICPATNAWYFPKSRLSSCTGHEGKSDSRDPLWPTWRLGPLWPPWGRFSPRVRYGPQRHVVSVRLSRLVFRRIGLGGYGGRPFLRIAKRLAPIESSLVGESNFNVAIRKAIATEKGRNRVRVRAFTRHWRAPKLGFRTLRAARILSAPCRDAHAFARRLFHPRDELATPGVAVVYHESWTMPLDFFKGQLDWLRIEFGVIQKGQLT